MRLDLSRPFDACGAFRSSIVFLRGSLGVEQKIPKAASLQQVGSSGTGPHPYPSGMREFDSAVSIALAYAPVRHPIHQIF